MSPIFNLFPVLDPAVIIALLDKAKPFGHYNYYYNSTSLYSYMNILLK